MRAVILMAIFIGLGGALAVIAPRAKQLRPVDEVQVVTGASAHSAAAASRSFPGVSSIEQFVARASPAVRRAYAAMMLTPSAPGLEVALRNQLGFVTAVTGTEPMLVCHANRCVLIGGILPSSKRGSTETLLRGSAMDDTLATWQLARGDWSIVPATASTPAGFVLFIDNRG